LGNIGSLAIFKYSGFIADSIDSLASFFGYHLHLKSHLPEFTLILPIGISFYTFQSMSYTIDVYRGHMRPVRNILHFYAYLSLFPQLVSGPIVRARSLIPQLAVFHATSEQERWDGLKLIVAGFFKKVVIADNLAPLVNTAFGSAVPSQSSLYWWVATSAFAFQIYFDFSGYSDIARGLAKWMGYDFLLNFNHPYTATSLKEFWTRWHISLSSWFRDYVYIPLGGAKMSKLRGHLNMWITLLISGLWHGASIHFLAWGALHAFFLSIERITQWPIRLGRNPWGRSIALILVWVQVFCAWVFFRAESIHQALQILKTMLQFNLIRGFHTDDIMRIGMIYLAVGFGIEIYHFYGANLKQWMSPQVFKLVEVVSVALLILACVFLRGNGMQFIYFQF
jgi:D-alanyl-lipoteichoic acid acyltransferase DltB (MBOAT superfamily)